MLDSHFSCSPFVSLDSFFRVLNEKQLEEVTKKTFYTCILKKKKKNKNGKALNTKPKKDVFRIL